MAEQRERAKADARAKRGQHADTGVYRDRPRRARPDRVARLRDARDRVERARAARRRRAGDVARGRRRRRAGPRPHAVLRRVRRPGRRRRHHRVRRRPARGARRPAPDHGLVVHQVRVVDGEFTPGAPAARAGRPRVAHRRPPGALRHPRRARRAARGARPLGAAVRLLQPARLPAPRLRLDHRPDARAGPRHRAGLQRGAARRPAGRLAVHDAVRGQGLGRDRALRRDLRQHQGARRRDRRPLVARALRWHARRPLLADRHRRGHRRGLGRVGQPPDRGVHRRRGLRLPRPRARRRRRS